MVDKNHIKLETSSIKKNTDIKNIAKLWRKTNYAASLKPTIINKHLSWKYSPKFTKVKLVKAGSSVVGTCGCFDFSTNCLNERIITRWGIDALTDKEYGKINPYIYLRAYRDIINPILRNEIKFIFGFPDIGSKNAYLNMGWIEADNIQLFVKNLKKNLFLQLENNVAKTILNFNFSFKDKSLKRKINFTKIVKFLPAYDKFFKHIGETYSLSIKKNHNYLNWRYCDCPSKKYLKFIIKEDKVPIGFVVLRIVQKNNNFRIGYIVDFFCRLNDLLLVDNLLKNVEIVFINNRVNQIQTFASNIFLTKALNASSYFIDKKIDFIIYSKNKENLDLLMKKRKYWQISMGDGDFEMED